MFIQVLFGYRQTKIFTIDCLTATLLDAIWATCIKQLFKRYAQRQQDFKKQISNHQKELEKNAKKLQQVDAALKQQQANNPNKADKKAPPKKGGKDAPVLSPLEQQKADLVKDTEFRTGAITKYQDKMVKIKQQLMPKIGAISDRMNKGEIVMQLVDKNGQRKFTKSKTNVEATQFLSNMSSYYLGYILANQADDDDNVQIIQTEGYALRFVQQDATANDQLFQPKKKDDKKKKKK